MKHPETEPVQVREVCTGLRIHVGHLRKPPKHRAWQKLHLAVDASTGEIVVSDLTGHRRRDCARAPALLDQTDDPVASISADGAHDTEGVYEAAQAGQGLMADRLAIPFHGADGELSRRHRKRRNRK